MQKKNWKDLNHLQIGKYAEYLAKMEFILYGFDVFTPELDHKGIDFIVRKDELTYFDIQVKSSRDLNYIFFLKEKFQLKENLYAVIVIFTGESKSDLYLIPSLTWKKKKDSLFVFHEYKDKKSPPEYGLNLSQKNLPSLEKFKFENVLEEFSKK